MKNRYKERDCLKRGGAWTVCRFKGDLTRKKEVVFLRGGCYPNAHYVLVNIITILTMSKKLATPGLLKVKVLF